MNSDPNKTLQNSTLHPNEFFCPPLNTSLNNQGKSPFNAFVTNELSPLNQNNSKNMFSRPPIKKFSFSEQIHDFVLQDQGSSNFPKEKDNLESYFNEDNAYSPMLCNTKPSHRLSLNYNNNSEENNLLTDIINNKNFNIIENMLDPIKPARTMESLKKSSVQHLINYTALSESEVNYKTPTFCHGTSTNSEDYSYKSPKFAGTPQNSFLLDTTPQRLLKSDVSSHDKINETDKIDKDPNEFVGCNCKKSRCLKLYCECFANEKVCVKNCNCFDCKNNIQNQDIRKKAMNSILIKNPHAFSSKVSTRKEFSPLRNLEQKTFVKKGCNCKKSNCRKKYCECYGVGLKCTDICKCEDCKNKENSKKSSSASQSRKGDEDVLNEEQVTLFKLGKKGRDESEEEKNINGKNKKEDLETKKKKKRKK